jgi:hypothetical protein
MPFMRNPEALSAMKAALKPLLEEAGFHPLGDRWERRRGDAVHSITVGWQQFPVVCAGIGYAPIVTVLQAAPPDLNLAHWTIPASELLQLWVAGGLYEIGDQGPRTGNDWLGEEITAAQRSASAAEAFRLYILRFFEDTSTIDAALREVQNEHRYGDCGPMSAYTPRINKFALACLYKSRGELGTMMSVIEHEMTINHPDEPWAAFRDWIVKP